ncbi:hypothetical protein ACFYO7_29695 [Nocardia salmonicida]|uniref:hypothetical protein n=1 Tax=Nocardia salmonicida TaxID=53431 RepID=UPI0036BFD788
MKMIVRTTAATLAITAALTCGTAAAETGDHSVAPDSGSALLAPSSFLAGLLQAGQCGSRCGADPTAAAQEVVGSSEVMDSLNRLLTSVVTTGSGPAVMTGSNEAATATGSSELAGALICGLGSLSSNGRPSICGTGPVG